eukprot:gene2451-2787_t
MPVRITRLNMRLDQDEQPIQLNALPQALEDLSIAGYSRRIGPDLLPQSLLHLRIGRYNRLLARDSLPCNLVTLDLGGYNHPIAIDVLPVTLKHLHLSSFKQPSLPPLPPHLETLHLGKSPYVPDQWPQTLVTLKLGSQYNQRLQLGTLTNLTDLALGKHFNQRIQPGDLPPSLVKLRFGKLYNLSLVANAIPGRLETLIFGHCYNQEIQPNTLPPSIKHIIFGFLYDQPLQPGILPQYLSSVSFESNEFNQPILTGALPPTLETLVFCTRFNQPFTTDALPRDLKHLTLGYAFNQPLSNDVLPPRLESLVFGDLFNQMEVSYPPTLKHLSIGREYILPDQLPPCITHLTLRNTLDRPIPPSIKLLSFIVDPLDDKTPIFQHIRFKTAEIEHISGNQSIVLRYIDADHLLVLENNLTIRIITDEELENYIG